MIFLTCKTGRRLREDLHLKGTEKNFTVASFLNSMFQEKGGQGPIGRKKSEV